MAGGSSGGSAGGAAGGAAMAGGSAGGSVDAGMGTKRTGEPCMRGSECLTNLCFGNPQIGVAFCVDSCVTDATCQPAETCLQVPNGMGGTTGVCVTSDTGASCPTGQPTMCIAGICLVHPGDVSQSVCATPCTSARACPTGTACSLTQIGATAQKVCTPVGGTCSSSGASTQCITRWCAASQIQPSMGTCAGQCTTAADCPAGMGCDAVLERCLPIGSACVVNGSMQNNCVSATCLQGAPQGDYCTVFCAGTSGLPTPARCPSGWSCINEGTAGNPAWVCER